MNLLESNFSWIITIIIIVMIGLGIVFFAYSLAFSQPLDQPLSPISWPASADYRTDQVAYVRPLDVKVIEVAYADSENIEKNRSQIRISSSFFAGDQTNNTPLSPTPTPSLTVDPNQNIGINSGQLVFTATPRDFEPGTDGTTPKDSFPTQTPNPTLADNNPTSTTDSIILTVAKPTRTPIITISVTIDLNLLKPTLTRTPILGIFRPTATVEGTLTETPVPTRVPILTQLTRPTDKPEATPDTGDTKPTREPKPTKEPKPTDEPKATKEPRPTNELRPTKKP